MLPNARNIFEDHLLKALRPKKRLLVWQWADKFRMLSTKDSAEPGLYKTSRTPYLREIMQELSSESRARVVVFKKGAQVGATTIGLNWIGYIIDHDPGMTMVVWPSLSDAKKNSKIRIDPLIEATPNLRKKISSGNNRDARNTGMYKDFNGGAVIVSGANSASSLRSVPAKNLFLDEVDGYPDDVDGEGDPIALVMARSRTFSKRKAFLVSTPTYKGNSKIDSKFKTSDQRFFYVPCPHCGEHQILGHENPERPLEVFDYLKYETEQTDEGKVVISASFFCKKCGEQIQEHHKTKMFNLGKWVKHNPKSDIPGFHLSGTYSPLGWYSWRDLCQDYEDALRSQKVEDMKVFINTGLGEVYEDKGERPAEEMLFQRREQYEIGTVPRGVVFLTCAVDIQADRLEAEVHGWGRQRERWSVDRSLIIGDPDKEEVWDDLEEYITQTFPHVDGFDLPIQITLIDSGFKAHRAYSFCRKFDPRRVMPIKGVSNSVQMVNRPKAVDIKENGKVVKRNGIKLWTIGVNLIKAEVYGDLKKEAPMDILEGFPPGFIHFPQYEKEYFLQLTAEERMVSKDKKGYTTIEWHKKRDRNETLDLYVYNRAAASIYGIDRFKDENWKKLEKNIMVVKKLEKLENRVIEKNKKKKRSKSGYW